MTLKRRVQITLLCLYFCNIAQAAGAALGDSAITLVVDDISFTHAIFSVFVLPGKNFELHSLPMAKHRLLIESDHIAHHEREEGAWDLQAPREPGLYSLKARDIATQRVTRINVFVLVPYSKLADGRVDGYRIGVYPERPFKKIASYAMPAGFVKVTQENADTLVSPHFTLRQFLCKQKGEYPKFLVVQSETLSMLEAFLDFLDDKGYGVETFGVISAYRTPYYNRLIGNVKYSRHIYGDAMDLYIDRDHDGRMDDLNNDGKRNVADVQLLLNLATDFQEQSRGRYVGGRGKYNANRHHGGFVHIDNRGYQARW